MEAKEEVVDGDSVSLNIFLKWVGVDQNQQYLNYQYMDFDSIQLRVTEKMETLRSEFEIRVALDQPKW